MNTFTVGGGRVREVVREMVREMVIVTYVVKAYVGI